MKISRLVSLATACAVTASAAAGCGDKRVVIEQKQQTVISFSWWGNDKRNEYTIEAIRQFEALYPDIKVNCSYSEWSGYEARSQVRMNSNTEADVMQINFNWLPDYSPDGTGFYDLENASDTIDFSTIDDDYLDYGRMNGVLNAVPIAMNTETIYINKTIYDSYGLDIPRTWDDFFAAAKVMRPDGVYPLAGAKKSIWILLVAYAEQVSGKTLLKEDGSLNFTSDEFKIMLDEYQKMVDEGVIPQVEYFVRTEIDNSIYAGTVAWVSDAVNYYSDRIENGDEIVTADYPNLDPEKSGDGWYAKPAQLYAISKNTEQPEEAALLVNFLINSKEMALLQGVDKGIPLSSEAKEYMEKEGMLEGIQYEASERMDSSENMAAMQPYMENSDVIDAFVNACNEVVYRKSASSTAADKLYQATKK